MHKKQSTFCIKTQCLTLLLKFFINYSQKLYSNVIFLPIALEARPSSASDDLNLLKGRGVLDDGRGVLDDPDNCCGVLGGLDVGRGDFSYLDVGRGDLLCFDDGLGVTSSSDSFVF